MSTKKIIHGRSQLLTFILERLGAIFDLLVLPYHKALLITSNNQHDDEVTW
jgi:succinate dehydrogenase hydrophobic anchor subunit